MPDELNRERLSNLLGMLGSAHDGEIANAGRAAHAMIREAGMSWPEVLLGADPGPIFQSASAVELDELRTENTKLRHEIEFLNALADPPLWHEPADEDEQIAACVAWRAFLDPEDREFVVGLLNKRRRRLGQHQAYRVFELVRTVRIIAHRVGRMAAA
jgi:hypothetical protein